MIETNPIPVKWALFEMSLPGPHISLSMSKLGDEFREPLGQCLNEPELIPNDNSMQPEPLVFIR